MPESQDSPPGTQVAPSAPTAPSVPGAGGAGGTKLVALLLGLLALTLGLRVPFAGGRGVALTVILGLVAGAVALVLGLGARTQALRAQAPVGLCTAAVAIAVAGTLVCSLWILLLFGLGPLLRGGPG